MAKLTRKNIGSLLKSKDPTKPNYIKIGQNGINLPAGATIRAESQKFQLASIDAAEKSGKLTGENLKKARDRAEKIPEFVIAELVVLEEAKG
jgi:hypothetical protein